MATPLRLAAIGECMIELRHRSENQLEQAFGGDTLNTAVYLARLAHGRFAVDYVTALGDDPYSAAMIAEWQGEAIGTERVRRIPGRLPGLYVIRTDAKGERSFYYWRGEAAARGMLAGEEGAQLAATLAGYDWLYFSGITLSILGPEGRARLMEILDRARAQGRRVAFDGNYRPRGWAGPDEARAAFTAALARVDLALPTFDDERALFGDGEPETTIARLRAAGVTEIAVKDGSRPATLGHDGTIARVAPPMVTSVVDTTAAGDAFNAGYLAARIMGKAPAAAAEVGHRLAGVVIGHRGAVIPKSAMPSGLLGSADG